MQSNARGPRSLLAMALLLMLLSLTSMTGCGWLYKENKIVVVDGAELIMVKKSTLNTLISDNEALLLNCH